MSVLRYGMPAFCPVRLRKGDPRNGSIDKIRVIFNDCLRLLTNNKRKDHAKIEDMLKELGWLSVNQLCAETRLVEAWKSVNLEEYCMSEILTKKNKLQYSTRSNDQTFLQSGMENRFSSASFRKKTAQIWNEAPREVKEAKTITQAKKAIRTFVQRLPI